MLSVKKVASVASTLLAFSLVPEFAVVNSAMAQTVQTSGVIEEIIVEGTQRIEDQTVKSYLTVEVGDRFDPNSLDDSLKAVFATGLFADANMRRSGNSLIVSVVENPVINRIAFEGNRRIDNELLETEVQLRPRVVYTRTRVKNDVTRILEIYRRSGRFAATVEPKIIQLDQNRVDLVFEIDEGPKTKIQKINFIGNSAFSDGDLEDEIQTAESRWYQFLSSDDTYDPDRLNYDKELLRRFYLSRGYADFRVTNTVAELSPNKEDFFITFTLEEGERYKFGEIEITSAFEDLDPEVLRPYLLAKEGDWYNSEQVEDTILALTDAVGDLQYAFVDIRPRVNRDRENKTIGLNFEIKQGPKVYIERIDVQGNVRTLDKVIRREFELVEGDAFNGSKLKRSEQKIRDLGFFERVQVRTLQGAEPDQSIVEVSVSERSTGELSIGAGFSSVDGALGNISIRERNFLGKGQDFRAAFAISNTTQQIDVGFTEPYFMDRDLTAGVDLFHITRDNQDESSYDEEKTGFRLRSSYPLAKHLRHSLTYTLNNSEITNVDSDASRFIQDQEGERLKSEVGSIFTYDRRDSRINPTEGYYVSLANDVAGLGGDINHFRTVVSGGYYIPLMKRVVLSAEAEVGDIRSFGDDDVIINERFFLGGNSLRGFDRSGVGPRVDDNGDDDALGGNQYYRGSLELTTPIGLPDELGVIGHVFTDVGSLWNVDADPRGSEQIFDDNSVRLSVGVGMSWKSPVGPIRIDYAVPVLKEEYDKEEKFRFSFGTRF